MNVQAIKLGNFKVNQQKQFSYLLPNDESTDLKMAIQPFLIHTSDDCILIDTGFSFSDQDHPLINEALLAKNISPNDITKVLLSHLHKDHIEGLGFFSENGFVQMFPNATIYIQKREYDYAISQTESHSYNQELLQAIKKLPNIFWLNEDTGKITPNISFEVTGGHTAFHQVFWYKNEDNIYFFGGDNLPNRSYLKRPIAYKTDFDGKKAREYRKIWEQKAIDEEWIIMLYHDMRIPFLEIKKTSE